jgi:pimeloyl-ACP methyl ester carboxylesterase
MDEETLTRPRRIKTGLHFEAHGQGPDILLTHGFGATGRMWDEQIEEFTDRYRLIVWDLPGHGESKASASEAPVEAMRTVLDAANADRAVLVGLGIGGLLSLRFWRAYPDRVRALILIGTMPGLRSNAAREIWNAQIARMAASLERDGLDALEGGAEVDPHLHVYPLSLGQAARDLLTQRDSGALPFLPEIDVPALILVGSEDKPNLTAADFMARVMPNATKTVITRANHAATLHKPGASNAAIRAFLRRLKS